MHPPQLPATAFDPPSVACPGCHATLKDPVPVCPHCGYNGWTCVEKFPWIPPALDRIMDVDRCLSPAGRRLLDKVIDPIEQLLPQVRIHVCLGRLHPDTDPREFGFWLFNASVPPDGEAASHRPWSVLLIVDRTSSRASLTIGYGLDPFLGDPALTACLEAGRNDFKKERYAPGAAAILAKLHTALAAGQRHATLAAVQYRERSRNASDADPGMPGGTRPARRS
jgi:hypothetical protein